jgi:hypothetical protein
MTALMLAHMGATCFMAGLIWFVQIVHYPLFSRVGQDGYANYQASHVGRTTWVVGPPMLVEAATAVYLAAKLGQGPGGWGWWLGLALLAVIWISTACLQVPAHDLLARGFDAKAHRTLVASNWLRTAGWSARALLVAWLVLKAGVG